MIPRIFDFLFETYVNQIFNNDSFNKNLTVVFSFEIVWPLKMQLKSMSSVLFFFL